MPGNQGTFLNTITYPEFTDLVRKDWVMADKYFPRNAAQLFIKDSVGAGNGSTKRYDELDTKTFADVKVEGGLLRKAGVGVGYNKTMTARTFGKEIDITLEMRNDNRYAEAGAKITSLSEFCPNRQDLDLTHRLTFASSTSYTDMNGYTVDTTTGDSLALLYSAHTLAFSSTTARNRVSGDPAFSQGSLEAAMDLANNEVYSNFGEHRTMNFNTIVSTNNESTVRSIRQLLQSEADVDGAQSGLVNAHRGRFQHVILPYLDTTAAGVKDSTKKRWWFVVAAGQGVNGWQAYLGEWIAPTLITPEMGNGMDVHTLNWTYGTYCRYGVVTVSWKGIVGSLPTS